MGISRQFTHTMQSDKSIYLRVKRPGQTVFLTTEPSETIAVAKNRLATMCEFPAENIRLGYNGTVLNDEETIGGYNIKNETEVYQLQMKVQTGNGSLLRKLFNKSMLRNKTTEELIQLRLKR